jgi:hypothetical protein
MAKLLERGNEEGSKKQKGNKKATDNRGLLRNIRCGMKSLRVNPWVSLDGHSSPRYILFPAGRHGSR